MMINNEKVCYPGCPCDQVFQMVAPFCTKPSEKYAYSTLADPEGKAWIEKEKSKIAEREKIYQQTGIMP